MKVAFLGLGQMGTPMATRLLAAGHELTVWNRTPERTKPLVDRGARAAATPAAAARGVDAAITMVATPEALEEVVFSEQGLVRALGQGQVLIEMSTVGPDVIRSVARRMPDGVTVVDAPVRGSVPQATEGTLAIFVGASDEAFKRVREILTPLGTVRQVGGPGAGASMKLVVNSALAASIVSVGEGLALGEALGLDRKAILDVLADSPVGAIVRAKRSNIETASYPSSFKLSLAIKDLRLVTETASRAGRELKLARAARAWLEKAGQAGAGDLDFSAVVATILDAGLDRHATLRPGTDGHWPGVDRADR
jgi:3-hydroxyisobutyrate dehydrogenase-like beta-hydroxyacid dehydrogenase